MSNPPPLPPPPPVPPSLPPENASLPHAAPPTFDPNLFPSRHRPWRQFLLDHNPCLLLSTVCMLLGCFLINSALKEADQGIKRIALLAVINLYEACIIPLGLVLIRRTRGAARDGWWLLLFEILFLVNATFINVDFGQNGWRWSFLFNAGLFVLACIKAGLLFRGLKIGLGLRTFGFFTLQLAIIYGLPIFFALVEKDGVVSPRIMYGLWWLVGLLPLLYDQIARADQRVHAWDLVQNVIRRVYLIAPWIMLVIHLRFSHWAHHSDFYLADLAPVFLGLAIASTRVRLDASARAVARALPVFAFFFCFQFGGELPWILRLPGSFDAFTVTPIHFTLPAILLTYGYISSMFHFLCVALAIGLAGIGYLFQNWIVAALRRMIRFFFDNLPDTTISWGVTAIIAAFVLLAVGSIISLKRTAFWRKTSG